MSAISEKAESQEDEVDEEEENDFDFITCSDEEDEEDLSLQASIWNGMVKRDTAIGQSESSKYTMSVSDLRRGSFRKSITIRGSSEVARSTGDSSLAD